MVESAGEAEQPGVYPQIRVLGFPAAHTNSHAKEQVCAVYHPMLHFTLFGLAGAFGHLKRSRWQRDGPLSTEVAGRYPL